MLTMLALAAAIIKRIGHAVLQYLLTSINEVNKELRWAS